MADWNGFKIVAIVRLFEYFFFSGDIGGQMGLFIGASILTVLEILDYIYEVGLCMPTHISQSRYEIRPREAVEPFIKTHIIVV